MKRTKNFKKTLPVSHGSTIISTHDPTARYLKEISHYPLLTKEEEFELAERLYNKGDQKAAQKLATSNLRFVVKIASEYTKFGLKLLDLIQEGNLGLIVAIKKFNPYKETRLTSYAVWWIRSYIHDYMLRQWSLVKIGTTTAQKKLFYKLKQEQEKLRSVLDEADKPKLLEHKIIAQKLGVKEKEVAEMELRMQGGDLSLNSPINEENSRDSFIDTIEDNNLNAEDMLTENNLQNSFNEHLDDFAETLNQRDLFIFKNRLLAENPISLREIGEKYNISRERARQLEEKIKKNLKEYVLNKNPDINLD